MFSQFGFANVMQCHTFVNYIPRKRVAFQKYEKYEAEGFQTWMCGLLLLVTATDDQALTSKYLQLSCSLYVFHSKLMP